ncbi:TonB-dependent receptor [Aliarcobacter lanthieri]|uniref:TonB-dependent receptor n=1 Tax=Aliarcobacter lanthieri TaxID=1355374 RepID=UPI003AA9AF38
MEKKLILASLFVSSLLLSNEIQTTKLDEIKVSANKIEENIQDVPQSITVITEEAIEQKGIKTIQDVIKEIPNMYNQNTIGSNTSFRGLNTSQFTHSNPVVIYVDGVPYYDKFDYNPSLADVEQIEVLRGPQGTLYGKDAIGAVINIVTKTPENKWRGTIGTEYGNDNTFDTKVNASGAIIDNKLFAGINNTYYHTDGWIENHYPGMDKHANKENDRKTSGFLLYKPTDNLSAKLTITNNYENKYGINGIVKNASTPINDFKRKDAKNVSFEMPTWEKTKLNSQALNVSYETQKIKFDSTTTHKKVKVNGDYDVDNMSGNSFDGLRQWNVTDFETTTQEFKLSSKNQDIKWVTGLYLDKEDRDQGPYGYESDYYGQVYQANYKSSASSKTQAIFGQVIIPIIDKVDLTLGGRYQRIKKEVDANVKRFWGNIAYPEYDYKDEKTWNSFLPKIALSYKVNDNLTTYVSVSKGYLPGGLNYTPSNATVNLSQENTFEPQKSLNYEIGAKYIGDNFALNTAIFRMDIKDVHVYYVDNIGNFFVDNAKKGHSQGIEIDGTYFLTDNWSISGALGLIQAKYDDFNNGKRSFDGERIQETPRYTANLGVSYLADSGIYGRVDLYAQGSNNFFNSSYNGGEGKILKTDGGITANAKIGYKINTWDIYAYIKNITNEDYLTSYMERDGNAWVGFNEPRKFGIGAIYKF